jgi:hypothetical protein
MTNGAPNGVNLDHYTSPLKVGKEPLLSVVVVPKIGLLILALDRSSLEVELSGCSY